MRTLQRLSLLLLLSGVACTPPPTIQTQAGQVAFRADQVVLRVNELQNTAINAEAQGVLDTNTTRTIVTWCVSANKTLMAAPAGWQATLRSGWAEVRNTVHTTNPAITAALAVMDALIGGL